MSVTSERIDQVIRIGLHPTLKLEGYRKTARTFRRAVANCTQITNVQGSWTNYADDGQFTVNLAVYFPEAARIHGLFRITDRPLESDCMINERLGLIMPIRRDYWWKVGAQANLAEIAEAVSSAWLNYGKPWLAEQSTAEGAVRFALSRKTPYWASVFCLMQGDRHNAKRFFDEAVDDASQNDGLTSRIEEWGRSNGFLA